MGSKTKTQTSTQATPWAPAQPYITDALSGLQGAANQSQASVAKTMPGLDAAYDMASNLTQNKTPYLNDATSQLQDTINGKYLDPSSNPYTAAIGKQVGDQAQAGYNSSFGAGGRAGGGLAAMLSSQGVGNALSSFYGGEYDKERQLQQNATFAAPTFYQNEFSGISPLLNLASTQALLPLQGANAYSSGVTAATAPYAGSNSSTTQSSSGLGQILGPILGAAGSAVGAGGLGSLLGGGGFQMPNVSGLLSGANSVNGLLAQRAGM